MKITTNQVSHDVVVENEKKQQITFKIDPSDMVQMALFGRVFNTFETLRKFELPKDEEFTVMLKAIEEMALLFKQVKVQLDEATGIKISELVFINSNSILLYEQFFEQLATEIEKAGVKVKDYVAQRRKEMLLNDHKDTL